MEPRRRFAFLLVILAQAAHSIEEYVFELYDVFAPARFISGLVAADRELGFLVVNASLVAFGVWCYVARVRPGRGAAHALAWGWALVEIANGAGHLMLAAARNAYFPGVATAPALLLGAVHLAWRLASDHDRDEPPRDT